MEVLLIRYRYYLSLLTCLILLFLIPFSPRYATAAVNAEPSAPAARASAVQEETSDAIRTSPSHARELLEREGLTLFLTADPDDLFGHEYGIFVEGKLREEWRQAHPDQQPAFDSPANYNIRGRDGERPVFMELYEDGRLLLSQDCGIRISGNFTRQSEQKSFRLYARKEYDEKHRFESPLFDPLRSADDGTILRRYKTLKIRNGGNDRSEGFIRDELVMTLAGMAGIADTQAVRPVSVYINEEYHGFYWMHSDYDETYFQERYGDYDGEMVIIGDGERDMETDSSDPLENQCAAEYLEQYGRFSHADLTEDALCGELDRFIDVENYLRYYAVQIYIGNHDWPYHNLEAYRYVSPDGSYREGTVFDGRYRYLLYDCDTSMGLGSVRDTLDPAYSLNVLMEILENDHAPLLEALLEREDCRLFFAGLLCDLANGAFSTQNVYQVLDRMDEERMAQISEYFAYTEQTDSLPDLSLYYLDMQKDTIRAWAETTPVTLLAGISGLWDLGMSCPVSLSTPEGCGAKINTLTVEGDFTGTYLTGCDVAISPLLPNGRSFVCWEINGTIYATPDLSLPLPQDGGALSIRLHTADSEGTLSLYALHAGDSSDYIVLTNPTSLPISTEGYYLMDKQKVSHMNYLDAAVLAPGECMLIGCKNFQGEDASMTVHFNLKKGELLTLGHSSQGIVDLVTIPRMGCDDSIYRKDPLTGIWTETRHPEQ